MADAIVTVDESSTLPEAVRSKLEEGLDTRYAPIGLDGEVVKTVNGSAPDGAGNVVVSGGGGATFTEDSTRPGIYLMGA
ncbi:hypothetical protein CH274_13120 [Rhodococcus sp. 06-418-5]|uniref:hypothetical protein n=1 Tax=Rhodococcus sp. 06-418-5 TaxID=2022507 RepID=UPI000B9C5A60|nr:hypothetical protein [Rhodococcus sp. 06-418-5]OZC80172.1 hypothetical protein CH274_13120 [Rhodococcus sp. 06-418-5]